MNKLLRVELLDSVELLDTAVEAMQENEALQERILETGKIMDRFEATVNQAMEEAQKEKEIIKAETQKVLKEKAQLTADLYYKGEVILRPLQAI